MGLSWPAPPGWLAGRRNMTVCGWDESPWRWKAGVWMCAQVNSVDGAPCREP
jgi:hypothetical protein